MASSDAANDGWFPLLSAVEAQDLTLIRSLLDDGANADQAVVAGTAPQGLWWGDWIGARPLLLAAIRGHAPTVEALLGRATLDLGNACYLQTAAFLSAREGNLDVLRLLAARGADLNQPNKYGVTPACVAAEKGHHEVLRVLVDNDADINRAEKKDGRTPAHMAAGKGHHEVLRVLQRGKARLDEPDTKGMTPMHMAVCAGHLDMVYYLARHGASLSRRDNEGNNALSLAQMLEPSIATLLKAVRSAGSWRKYIARLRLPYCLIRHEVSRTELVCPVNEDEMGQQGLYHFIFGAGDEVVEQGPVALLRAAPDDVFAVIGSFLGVRLR